FCLTWIPLVVLSLIEGLALAHRVQISLLGDYSVNIRFLLALPLFIMAEATIDPHIREAVRHFVSSGLVTEGLIPAYENIIKRTIRLRDHWAAKVILVLLAYAPSFWSAGEIVPIGNMSTWHYDPSPGSSQISLAGLWFAFVSIPLYRLFLF